MAVFTKKQLEQYPHNVEIAQRAGKKILLVADRLAAKIDTEKITDNSGKPINIMSQVIAEYQDNFEFNFINPKTLTSKEKEIFNYTENIADLFGGIPKRVKNIEIASELRKELYSSGETLGCWDPKSCSIVIHRKTLKSLAEYSGTLIHEIIHAKTGLPDINRQFENSLTDAIGLMCEAALKIKKPLGKLK